MPRCYMVKKSNPREESGPAPASPTEASVAPPCYSPLTNGLLAAENYGEKSVIQELEVSECRVESEPQIERYQSRWGERSAEETEAAHELLSLSQSLPPLPPPLSATLEPPLQLANALDVSVQSESQQLYIQPTHIYILADDSPLTFIEHDVTTDTSQIIQGVDIANYINLHNETETVSEVYLPTDNEITIHEELQSEVQENYVEVAGTLKEAATAITPPTSPPLRKRVSNERARYACNDCGKRYATSSNLSRHKQTHRSLDSVAAKRCGECGKAYVSMPALAMHVLTHQLAHVCGVCGKLFSRPWLLQGHLRSHTGEKPYRCSNCGKAFSDRSNLRAHMQTHSSDKNYRCDRCQKTFALKSYLNKHQESACLRASTEEPQTV